MVVAFVRCDGGGGWFWLTIMLCLSYMFFTKKLVYHSRLAVEVRERLWVGMIFSTTLTCDTFDNNNGVDRFGWKSARPRQAFDPLKVNRSDPEVVGARATSGLQLRRRGQLSGWVGPGLPAGRSDFPPPCWGKDWATCCCCCRCRPCSGPSSHSSSLQTTSSVSTKSWRKTPSLT